MRIALVPEFGAWSASTRYRALLHVDGLEALGHQVDVLLPDDRPSRAPGRVGQVRFFASHAARYARRWSSLRRALSTYDAVLVQRAFYPMGPGLVARPVEDFGGRVVLDLDDAVFEDKPSMAGRGPVTRWLYSSAQARRALGRADAVVVSTENLRDAVAEHGAPVVVLPTVLDPRPYRVADQATVEPSIVWAGTVGGLPYLELLRPALERLQEEERGRLTVVSSAPWDGPALFRPWRAEDEFDLMADFAVGVMPLPDTAYTRGKAGFKLLQYMASGVPVVASPVGVNRELVEASGAGLLAEGPEEWFECLHRLLTDAALREECGRRGRAFVERYCDLPGQARAYDELLRGR